MRGVACLVAVLAVSNACTGDSPVDVSAASAAAVTTTTTPPPTTTTTTTASASTLPATTTLVTSVADPVACLDGIWTVASLTAANGNFAFVGPVTGMTMSFGDGTWTLDAVAATVAVEVRGIAGTATLDGQATGLIISATDRLTFQLSAALGTAIAEADGLQRDLSFEELLVALGPVGTTTVTCEPTRAVLATRSTSLDLQREG